MNFQEWNSCVLGLYNVAQQRDVAEFHEYALACIKDIIPFDSAIIGGGEMTATTPAVITSAHLHNQPVEKLIERHSLEAPDPVLIEAFQKHGRTVTRASATLPEALKPYCKKFGVAHTMVHARTEPNSLRVDVISLWRANDQHDYAEREVMIADMLLPHVMEARMINLRLFTNEFSVRAAQQSRPIVVNMRGEIQFMEMATLELLRTEWPEWNPPILPANLMDSLQSKGSIGFTGKRLRASVTVRDKLLYLSFRERDVPQAEHLTEAERAVAKLAITGASYKDIARHLSKSPSTVRNQLHTVYDKLEIKSKVELANLFKEEIANADQAAAGKTH